MDPALLLFAFAAGAAAFFAPCCVAMLPAYVGYAVRPKAGAASEVTELEGPLTVPPTPRFHRQGLIAAGFGLLPFGVGSAPMAVQALSSLAILPASWTEGLPPIEVSLGLIVLGAALTVGGLIAAGKGAATARGALFGALATAGFFTVYLALGVPVAFLARGLIPYLPWVAATVGVVLVVLGVGMLAGKTISPRMPGLKASPPTPKGFFLFGVGYGTAGLSCTFPLFLAVVAAGALSGGFTAALATFAAFALGKGTLLTTVTALTVAGGESLGSRVKRYTRHVQKASAWMLILAGAYVAYYYGKTALGFV